MQDKMIRKTLLLKELQRMRKFVLIFDDVWEDYPPEEIGIPIGDDSGTLIITPRLREVCQKMCKEVIRVDPLDKEEAWELFNKTLERHSGLSPKEEEIAKDVVKECVGLPLAIITTARSLDVVYDIAKWRNALYELKEHVKGRTIDIEDQVFKVLGFSYHRLNNDKIQECLLYCALFPKDFEIRRISLIRYWIAEGLIEEMGSRQAEQDRGHAILNKLENACLLERCADGKAVRMHDMIRDMAINITRKDSRFLVKTGRKGEDLCSEMSWPSNLERVSFFDSRLSSSKFEPNCPKLSTMFLRSFSFLLENHVPMLPFMHTTGLRVLDLSYTSFPFLPESVYDLVNLRALILCGCRQLKHVSLLAKLKELRMLDFSDIGIETIPDGIEKLVSLKQFYWTSVGSQNGQLAVLDPLPKLLSNLVLLQCLSLLDRRVRDLGAEELGRLTKLEILCTKFSSLHNFNSYMSTQHYRRLSHYFVHLVERTTNPTSFLIGGYCKQVHMEGINLKEGRNDNGDDQRIMLPTDLHALHLDNCLLPASLWDVSPSLNKMMDLEDCRIQNCQGIEYLSFKLRRTDIGSTFCSSLKHLEVRGCHNLKHLFTVALAKYHLQNFVTIRVWDCENMEDMIVAEPAAAEEEEEVLSLPNLQKLDLVTLPNLKSIWKGTMTCDSLQQIAVIDCRELKRLPFSVDVSAGDGDGERRASSPPLQQLIGYKMWWDRVEWDTHPAAKSLFQHLLQPQVPGIWILDQLQRVATEESRELEGW